MTTTNELGITLIAAQQVGSASIADAAFEILAGASNGYTSVACGAGGTITVADSVINSDLVLVLTGAPGAAFTLEVADGARVFWVQNDTDDVVTVDTTTGSAATFDIPPGGLMPLRSSGVDLTLMGQGNLYPLSFWFPGGYTNGELLTLWVAPRALVLPADLYGSRGYAKTDPLGSITFDIQVNAVSKGSMAIAAGANAATFTFAAAVSLAAGDRLEIFGPATLDADLADVGVSLEAYLA